MWEIILKFIGFFVFLTAIIYIIICYLEKIEKLIAWLYKIYNFLSKRGEKKRIGYDIQAQINELEKTIDNEVPDSLPYAVKIEWVKELNTEAFKKKNQIIIRLDYHKNQNQNLIKATLLYLSEGLLRRSRPYVDDILMKATDFTVAKKVFVKSQGTAEYFFDEVFNPEAKVKPNLGKYCSKLEAIDYDGLFTRVFLRELKHYGDRLYPAFPTKEIKEETVYFLNYLNIIAEKKIRRDVELDFSGRMMHVHIMLFTKPETAQWGILPYLNRINICIARGVERLYMFGIRGKNISFIKKIVKEAYENKKINVIDNYKFKLTTYRSRVEPAICIVCSARVDRKEELRKYTDSYLEEIILNKVPEVKKGKIEIICIAREPGIRSKVCVDSLSDDIDALRCVVGTQGCIIKEISRQIGRERIDVIRWTENDEQLIKNSLGINEFRGLRKIDLDYKRKKAFVYVTQDILKDVLGPHGLNKSLAEKITGWNIKIIY